MTGGVSGLQGFIESEGGSDGEFLLGEGVDFSNGGVEPGTCAYAGGGKVLGFVTGIEAFGVVGDVEFA